jgi:tRNA-2-methylthio-N6-dimethylallyladenosine synthase
MNSSNGKRSVLLNVFGCQMNKLDAELVKSLLFEDGYAFTEDQEEAGVILFVTCSVREHAENRVHSRVGALKAWKKRNPEGVIGILGCMAQKEGTNFIKRHPHVDLVVGTRDFPDIVNLLDRAASGHRGIVALDRGERPDISRNENVRPHRFKAFLSIMRGCDSYCTYCVVPSVRGHEESRPLSGILDEARRLIDTGVLEITLLGQTVNRYDDGNGHRLPELLRSLDAMPGLKRLNFVTSNCAYVDQPLIDAIADCQKVSRFLHLPAQSGSDRILERMNRKYTAGGYLDVVGKLREAVPGMEFGSDFIVGFPGETVEDFEATEQLLEKARFQQSFIFKYSPRPGTLAAEKYVDDVPREVKEARNARLLDLQNRISSAKNARLKGGTVDVLVEGVSRRDPARYTGRTACNQIVAFPGSPELVGRLIRVKVDETTALTLLGNEAVEVLS